MRRLLLVTFHFPPSAAVGGRRLLGFARHLPKSGWSTAVVAPPMTPFEPADWDLCAQIPDGTPIYHAPYGLNSLLKPVVLRVAPWAAWLPRGLAACRRAVRAVRPDACLTSSPPHVVHLLGFCLKRWYRIPWIADFRDPCFTCDPRAVGHWGERSWSAARLEQLVMESADAIIANTPLFGALLRAAYPAQGRKVETITNGFDPEAFGAPTAATPRADSPWTILHTGAVYAGRDVGPFLDALRSLARDRRPGGRPPRVTFLGMEAGSSAELAGAIRQRGLEAIVAVEGHVPYAQALRRMVDADVLLLLDTPGRRLGIPAKLYEYIGAGRPVLALGEGDGDVAWVLNESGIPHRLAAPTDPAGIVRALGALAEGSRAGREIPAGTGGRERFTRGATARDLARVLDRCLERGGAPPPARVPGPAAAVGAAKD